MSDVPDIPISISELQDIRRVLISAIKKIDASVNSRGLTDKALSKRIFEDTCMYYNMTPMEMRSICRKKELIQRRKTLAHILRNYTGRSLQEIAYMLGYKKHETVLFHVKDVNYLLSDEVYGSKDFKKQYYKLLSHLNLNDK